MTDPRPNRLPTWSWVGFCALLPCLGCTAIALPRSAKASAPRPDDDGQARWGAEVGDYEFAIGSVAVTPDLDQGLAAGTMQLGWHFDDCTSLVMRHNGSYVADGRDQSFQATRVAIDLALAGQRVLPFVGCSLGLAYGESINETVLVGVHVGLRAYVQPKAFLEVVGGYDYFSTKTEDRTEIFYDSAVSVVLSMGVLF